jgi:ABC-type nitrate/sulfonate/bicarbonate transport system ATPase subunit
MDPKVLLMDEPFSALDALTRGTLQEELARIWMETQKTVMMITNDIDEAILLADAIYTLTPAPARHSPAVRVIYCIRARARSRRGELSKARRETVGISSGRRIVRPSHRAIAPLNSQRIPMTLSELTS